MERTRRFPWIPVLIGGCCLVFLCICCIVVGGLGAVLYAGEEIPSQLNIWIPMEEVVEAIPTPVNPTSEITVEIPTLQASVPPPATVQSPAITATAEMPAVVEAAEIPATDEPTESVFTGNQQREDYRIFDDFSSEAMEWSMDEDEYVNLSIIDEAYNIHVLKPDDLEYVYFPLDFIPYEIAFDAKGPSGDQDGTFGVYCHHLDEDNTYDIEFDLTTKTYVISEVKDSEIIPLTKVNSAGQYWQPIKPFKSPPTSSNHIAVSCYLDSITLFVNDKLVDQVTVSDPLPGTGDGAIYVYTFPFADKNGYEITIDNVEIFQPVQ